MSNIAGTVIDGLLSVAGLGWSVFGYIRQHKKIPRLAFDGYFKTEQHFITGNIPTKVTTYCVKIINVNPKSEYNVLQCAGTLSVGSEDFRTVWMSEEKRQYNFVKQAWLKFDVDQKDQTVGFFDAIEEFNVRRVSASIGRRMGDYIRIQLEAARGRCPEPLNESVEYIIKKAEYL